MANKSLSKLLDKVQEAAAENKDIEPLSNEEAEELSGGSVNAGCPNKGCNSSCPVENSGCSPSPT